MYEIAADNGGTHAPAYKQDANDQHSAQGKVRETATEDEKDRDRMLAASATHETRHHWLTGAATLIEIGIALSTVAIFTKRREFWFGAMGSGAVGVSLFVMAYLARISLSNQRAN
jgi:hypothetical protein